MGGFLDLLIELATWAKANPDSFYTRLSVVIAIIIVVFGYLRRRLYARFSNALEKNEQLKAENETLAKHLLTANKRLDEINPTIVLKKLRDAEAAKDKRALEKISDAYFKEQRVITPVFARALARARLDEMTEDAEVALGEGGDVCAEAEAALADAERFLTIGQAAEPQDAKIVSQLEDVRAQRLALASGRDEAEIAIGSSNNLTALRAAYNNLRKQGKYQLAIVIAERALNVSVSQFGTNAKEAAQSHHDLGALFREQGIYDQAEKTCLRQSRFVKNQGNSPLTQRIL